MLMTPFYWVVMYATFSFGGCEWWWMREGEAMHNLGNERIEVFSIS